MKHSLTIWRNRSTAILILVGILVPLAVSGPAQWPAEGAERPGLLIRLRRGAFDPLRLALSPVEVEELAIPAELRLEALPDDGPGLYIVQFSGPVRQPWKDAVTARGAHIYDYLPDYAFVVRMDKAARAAVESLKFVRWVGPFHPAYKVPYAST